MRPAANGSVRWLILAMALQWGCMPSFQSEEPPTRLYWLQSTSSEPSLDAYAEVRVDVVPGLDSDHIWILQRDQRLNYYAGAHWPHTLSVLLQSIMERALGHPHPDAANLRFAILVERFFAVDSAADSAPVVELLARITRLDEVAPVCTFDAREAAATPRLRDIVAAHQALLDQLIYETQRLASAAAGGQAYTCR